jgi:hypothetical protein
VWRGGVLADALSNKPMQPSAGRAVHVVIGVPLPRPLIGSVRLLNVVCSTYTYYMEIKLNAEASERLFAALCRQFYLKGFVFHSPKYKHSGGEDEVGDVVLWVRDILIVFEIIWRSPGLFSPTKSFIKRIGEKRDQLIRDYKYYADTNRQIKMRTESGEVIFFDHQCFNQKSFSGVVIVDSDIYLEKLHFETVKKSLEQEFPIAIMTKQDFIDLLAEVDTPADLFYYINDRTKLLRAIFKENAHFFLDLNARREQQLIGFYKLNNNSFPVKQWKETPDKDFWQQYQLTYAERIAMRDQENADSYIIDEVIDLIRRKNKAEDSTLLHAWELAILPRRSRAGLPARKIRNAFRQLGEGKPERHFAFYNQATGCWSVFYFHFGADQELFKEKAKQLAKWKIQVERIESNFKYSVFCYAFRRSSIITGNTFDTCVLWIEDAENYPFVSQEEYDLARRYFGGTTERKKIKEFPI